MSNPRSRQLLSPEAVLEQIAGGTSAQEALARLDLGQCQFHEQVGTSGYDGPVIPMQGFGRVAKGKLALHQQTVDAYETAGTDYITAITDRPDEEMPTSKNAIFGADLHADTFFFRPDHLGAGMETSRMTWLRHPGLTFQADQNTVTVDDVTIAEHTPLTLDARLGRMYLADLPVHPIPESTTALDNAAKQTLPDFQVLANALDDPSVCEATSSTADGIGLYRSETITRDALVKLGNGYGNDGEDMDRDFDIGEHNLRGMIYSKPHMRDMFRALLTDDDVGKELRLKLADKLTSPIGHNIISAYRLSNGNRQSQHTHFPLTYRLSDPDVFLEEMEETCTISAEEKTRFYRAQVVALFEQLSTMNMKNKIPLSVLVPSIKNAEELAAIKEAIDEEAKAYGYMDDDGTRQYRFGAMLETKEAVQPAEAGKIARLVDFASFGTNDLTREITGLKRDDLDEAHQEACRAWMAEHHHARLGNSPYEALVPPVTRAMETATKAMRAANPDIQIGCCGRQVAGHAESIKAVIAMGLDNISVPPQDVAAARITAAHFAARKALRLEHGR